MREIGRLVLAMFFCCSTLLTAQEPVTPPSADGLCYRARPRSECRAFVITTAGPLLQLDAVSADQIRLAVDLGLMSNVSERSAVGGSLFIFGQSGENVALGPTLRWRRWLTPTRSLDLGVGTPVYTGDSESFDKGSVLGLVKYNPISWLGVVARPELIRSNDYNCTVSGCPPPVRGIDPRLYVGAEIGEAAGLGLGIAAGVTTVVILLVLVTGSDFN